MTADGVGSSSRPFLSPSPCAHILSDGRETTSLRSAFAAASTIYKISVSLSHPAYYAPGQKYKGTCSHASIPSNVSSNQTSDSTTQAIHSGTDVFVVSSGVQQGTKRTSKRTSKRSGPWKRTRPKRSRSRPGSGTQSAQAERLIFFSREGNQETSTAGSHGVLQHLYATGLSRALGTIEKGPTSSSRERVKGGTTASAVSAK